MLPLQAIEATLQGMRKAQEEADRLQGTLQAEVQKISSEPGRTLDYINEKVKEAREKAVPGIYEQLNIINSEAERLTKAAPFWQDVKFVLSGQPLTAASKENPSLPADPANEAISRLAKLTELSKMDAKHLQLAATSAMQENRHGELYLISLENDSRAGKEGWSGPIILDSLQLPERDKALDLLNEARTMASTISSQIKTANGRPATPLEKLQAARA